jgi:hypothetical protein
MKMAPFSIRGARLEIVPGEAHELPLANPAGLGAPGGRIRGRALSSH